MTYYAQTQSIRYLRVYLVSCKNFSISLDYAKTSFYRAFNAVFDIVGRVASQNVVVKFLKTKCLPILLYGLEACPLTKTQLKSLNSAISSCFRKILMSARMRLSTHVCACLTVPLFRTFCVLEKNVVCALCRHKTDIELALLSA